MKTDLITVGSKFCIKPAGTVFEVIHMCLICQICCKQMSDALLCRLLLSLDVMKHWQSGEPPGGRCHTHTCWDIPVHFPKPKTARTSCLAADRWKAVQPPTSGESAHTRCLPRCRVSATGEQINSRDDRGIIWLARETRTSSARSPLG